MDSESIHWMGVTIELVLNMSRIDGSTSHLNFAPSGEENAIPSSVPEISTL